MGSKFFDFRYILSFSDFNEFDVNKLNISSDIPVAKTSLYTKSKSSIDVSKNDYSTTPNVKFFRRHKSPSLDIEIKEAELIAQGLLPRRESCSSLENISWNGLVFDSSEDHSNFCENLCHSVKCETSYLRMRNRNRNNIKFFVSLNRFLYF